MKHVWSTLLGVTLGAVPVAFLLTQPSTGVTPIVRTNIGFENKDNSEKDARLSAMEDRLEKLLTRLDRSEGAMMGSNHIDKRGGENTPPILPSDSAKFDASAQDSITTARQENSPMSQDQVAQEQAYEQQTTAALSGQLASEDYDADWAGNFQADLDQGLKTENFMGTHLSDVECKSSLCRVTLAHDNPETEEQFFEHMLELPVMSNTQAYYQRESHGDGSASLVLYVAREGQALPLPMRETKVSN